MDQHLANLFLALGIFSLGFVSIGPNILAIVGTSMDRGRPHGVALALGVGTGSGIWAILTVSGLTIFVTAYAGAITFLKIFGVIYLLWLASKAFKSALSPNGKTLTRGAKGNNLYLQGLTIQMTNPKAALHWVAIVGIGLGPEAPLWVGASLVISTTIISMLGHLGYAVAFSTKPVAAFYGRARRWIEGFLGLFFTFAAFRLVTFRN